MNLQSYFFVFDSALPSRVCDEIISFGNLQQEEQGLTGAFPQLPSNEKDISKLYKTRNSSIVWMNEPWIYKEILPYINMANAEANWNFDVHLTEACQFTKYSETQHYSWHVDSFREPSNKIKTPFYGTIRKLSATISLADGDTYEGGDLEFDLRNSDNGESVIRTAALSRKKGSIIVFPSFVYHRVAPVTKGTRYSLVLWCSGEPYR